MKSSKVQKIHDTNLKFPNEVSTALKMHDCNFKTTKCSQITIRYNGPHSVDTKSSN